jgi:hypothetical protein
MSMLPILLEDDCFGVPLLWHPPPICHEGAFVSIPPRLIPLLAQFDFAFEQLATRLGGLSDAEYFWEPVPHCWSIRPRGQQRTTMVRGGGAWVLERMTPDPAPPPFTTIAWRLGHLGATMFLRADHTIGTKSSTHDSYDYPGSAAAAVAALVAAGSAWREALIMADDAALDQVGRCSYPSGSDPDDPFIDIVWWENQELLHHGAEIALLRDLYRAAGGAVLARS